MFYKVLNSKNNKDIWRTIDRILNPNTTTIKESVEEINKFFNNTAKCVTEKSPTKFSDIKTFIKSVPENLPIE